MHLINAVLNRSIYLSNVNVRYNLYILYCSVKCFSRHILIISIVQIHNKFFHINGDKDAPTLFCLIIFLVVYFAFKLYIHFSQLFRENISFLPQFYFTSLIVISKCTHALTSLRFLVQKIHSFLDTYSGEFRRVLHNCIPSQMGLLKNC